MGQNDYNVFGLQWNHMSGEAWRKILLELKDKVPLVDKV